MSSNGARRVLIVTFEFPPSGGGGVQRMAKFARYLPEGGWTPVVVAAEPVVGRPRDDSLVSEVAHVQVVRTPSRHPSVAIASAIAPIKRLVRGTPAPVGSEGAATKPPADGRVSLSARIARRITSDDAQLWVDSAVKSALAVAAETPVDAVLASGPPFTVTEAGRRIASKLGVPLVVDLRDAWRDNPVAYYPSSAARKRSVELQRRVMAAATVVTATTPAIVAEAAEMGAARVEHLPNGYDPDDLSPWAPRPGALRLAFMGKVYRGHSDPWPLLDALGELKRRRPELEVTLEFIGERPAGVAEAATARGIGSAVSFTGYLPHHVAVRRLAGADVAVQLIADRPGAGAAIGGKVFEYLAVGIPVLVIGPAAGETAELVERVRGGVVVQPGDTDAIAAAVERYADAKATGALEHDPDRAAIERYDRCQVALDLARVLDSTTESGS